MMIMETITPLIRRAVLIVAAGVMSSITPVIAAPSASQCRTLQECAAIGELAYIYGYPAVIEGVTKQDFVQTGGNLNQFVLYPLPSASFNGIVLPSVNTPYSNAFLDVTRQPIILHLPDMHLSDGSRPFNLVEVMDAWTDVGGRNNGCLSGQQGFCSLGTRYGTQEGDYAFVGPNWHGSLPSGIRQVITLPTNSAWLAGRVLTTGTTENLNEVNDLRNQWTLTPLSQYGQSSTPPAPPPTNARAMPPYRQVANMDAATFYSYMANIMSSDAPPLLPQDQPVVDLLAKIGMVPGQPYDLNSLDLAVQQAVEAGYQAGYAQLNPPQESVSLTSTNWQMPLDLGDYGDRYLERAMVAREALGANLSRDAVYAYGTEDSAGNPLNGANLYKIHFDAGEFPPANPNAFWSVTLYQLPDENVYDNLLGRNALGIPTVEGHDICFNSDGSLDFYIQHNAPSQDQNSIEYCNWLPTPTGDFLLLLRMYWPSDALFEGWVPPEVQIVAAPEPSSLALLGAGLALTALWRRRGMRIG